MGARPAGCSPCGGGHAPVEAVGGGGNHAIVTHRHEAVLRHVRVPHVGDAGQRQAERAAIVDEAREKVQAMLSEKKSLLDKVARTLLEKETLEGEELRELISNHSVEHEAN